MFKKSVVAVILAICFCFSSLPLALAAGVEDFQQGPLDRAGVLGLHQELFSAGNSVYQVVDGKLETPGMEQLVNELNFYRRLAGVSPVTLDAAKSASAQAGVEYMSRNNSFGHQAADEDEDGTAAQAGLHGSCLVYGNGTAAAPSVLLKSMLDDYDIGESTIDSNVFNLGHRRWLLDPAVESVGVGYYGANSENNHGYLAIYVADDDKEAALGRSQYLSAYPGLGACPYVFV